jgi:rhomboid domain-containing protein 1
MKFKDFNYDFYCSIGFSGVLFSLFYFWCNFSSISETYQNFLLVAPIKSKYLPLCYLIFIQILNPNSSFLGHLSGIISGVLIKYIFVYFTFPNKEWILQFEQKTQGSCLSNFVGRLNYKNIESVGAQDISEIDVRMSDFSFIKLFKRLFSRNNNNNFERQNDQENQ